MRETSHPPLISPQGLSRERITNETIPLLDAGSALTRWGKTRFMSEAGSAAIQKAAAILSYPEEGLKLGVNTAYFDTMKELVPTEENDTKKVVLEKISAAVGLVALTLDKISAGEPTDKSDSELTVEFVNQAYQLSSHGFSLKKTPSGA